MGTTPIDMAKHVAELLSAQMTGLGKAPAQLEGASLVWSQPSPVSLKVLVRSLPTSSERILELIVLFARRQQENMVPAHNLLTIRVPRLPNRTDILTADYGRLVPAIDGPSVNWAIVDDQGGSLLHLESLGIVDAICLPQTGAIAPRHTMARPATSHRDPMRSEIALTLLKILLARQADTPDRWGAHLNSISELAAALKVPASSIYTVLRHFQNRGWIASAHGKMPDLIDIHGVVQWWLDRQRLQPPLRFPVAPLYERPERRHETIMQWLAKRTTTQPWAVNGWSACRCHSASVLIEPEAKPFSIAYLGTVDRIADEWGLARVDRIDDPRTLFLVEPVTMAKPLFSTGMLGGFSGVPVVDLWQAALDVVSDSDRGIEQAEGIAELLWPNRG